MKILLEIFSGIILQPKITLSLAARERKLGGAVVLYCLVLFFSFASQIIANEQRLGHLLLGLPFFLLGMLAILFLHTAVLQLGAEFLGGKGRGIELFIGLALANIPYVFSAPAALLGRLNFFLGNGLEILINLILFLWVCILSILAVKEIEEFSTGRALFTLCLPWVLVIGGIILLGLMFAMIIAVLGLGTWLDFHHFMGDLSSL